MALYDNGSADVVMPVAPMGMGGGNNGTSFGWGGDGSFWIIILFLFAMFNGGWGTGWGNNNAGGMFPYMMNNTTNNDMQRGFDQSAIMNGINGINSSLANAEVSRCNGISNVIGAVNGGFTGLQSTLAANQMGLYQTLNGNQSDILQAMNTANMTQMQNTNTLAMSLQNCCCENRAGLADLKYNIATEACADRQAVNNGVRDIMAANSANTNALLNTINSGIQSIQDKLCQQEIDALKAQNANLQTQVNLANLQASQTAQTGQILADNAAQTVALERYLNPAPIPAYVVANPNSGCGCGYNTGCGCGM